MILFCHGRACPGHPRLSCLAEARTWMPGTSPGMTRFGIMPILFATFFAGCILNQCLDVRANYSEKLEWRWRARRKISINNDDPAVTELDYAFGSNSPYALYGIRRIARFIQQTLRMGARDAHLFADCDDGYRFAPPILRQKNATKKPGAKAGLFNLEFH